MTRLFKLYDVNEETQVQFVGVYTMKWRPEWGDPTAMFAEVDDPVYDAAPELLTACKYGHDTPEGWEWDIFRILDQSNHDLANLFRRKMKLEHDAIAKAEREQ